MKRASLGTLVLSSLLTSCSMYNSSSAKEISKALIPIREMAEEECMSYLPPFTGEPRRDHFERHLEEYVRIILRTKMVLARYCTNPDVDWVCHVDEFDGPTSII